MESAGWLSGPNHSFWSSPITTPASGASSARTAPSCRMASCVASWRARVTSATSSRPIHAALARAFAANSGRRARSRSPRPANASYGVLSIGLCELPMPSVTCAMPRSCRPRRLAERGDDVLGEELHLPLLLIPGHEALIEEPAEPFEIALAADLLQRLDLALDLVHRSGQGVLDLAHPVDRPLRRRQRGVRIERILRGVLGRAERLPEAEAPEVVLEACVVGVAEQGDRLGLGLAEVNGPERAHALAQAELAPVLPRDLLVDIAQALEVRRVRHEDPGHDARLGGVADGRLAHRERLEHGRVRLLIRLRHDADLPDHAFVVDLAGGAVLPGPVGDRPAPDPFLVGVGDLVVLAVVVPRLLGPGLLDDLDRFLVDPAVVVVDGGAVHGRARDVILLAQDVDPPVLVPAGEPGIDAPLRQVVEDRQLLGGPDGIPRRQHQPERGELDPPGAGGQVEIG